MSRCRLTFLLAGSFVLNANEIIHDSKFEILRAGAVSRRRVRRAPRLSDFGLCSLIIIRYASDNLTIVSTRYAR